MSNIARRVISSKAQGVCLLRRRVHPPPLRLPDSSCDKANSCRRMFVTAARHCLAAHCVCSVWERREGKGEWGEGEKVDSLSSCPKRRPEIHLQPQQQQSQQLQLQPNTRRMLSCKWHVARCCLRESRHAADTDTAPAWLDSLLLRLCWLCAGSLA